MSIKISGVNRIVDILSVTDEQITDPKQRNRYDSPYVYVGEADCNGSDSKESGGRQIWQVVTNIHHKIPKLLAIGNSLC